MKTIGLIGGMSWESTKVYYEYINKMVAERLGGSHSAKILLSSVDFAEIEVLSLGGDWNRIGILMAGHAQKLQQAGADMIVLCTNTIHLVCDRIEHATSIPFVHIAKATGEAVVTQNLNTVGLLGTKFTMEKDFYRGILEEQFGLKVLVPELDDRNLLQDIIYNQLVKGQFTAEAKNQCLGIIEKLKAQGAQGVIMGCTELPILIPETEVDIPSFDTTRIHATKAVGLALR